jgi:hypothetical protein
VHERVERTSVAHCLFECRLDALRVFEEIDANGACGSAGRFDRGDRVVGRRIAIGYRDAREAVARKSGSDAGGEAGSGSRYERTPIQRAARSSILVRNSTTDRSERRPR